MALLVVHLSPTLGCFQLDLELTKRTLVVLKHLSLPRRRILVLLHVWLRLAALF